MKVDLDIEILDELRNLITPLNDEEYKLLENSLKINGCLDPLKLWFDGKKYFLVDGHNRFEICSKHNIYFDVHILDFDELGEVKSWMIKNQLGRRNLTPIQLAYFRGIKYISSKQGKGGYSKVEKKGSNVSTAMQLANQFDTSPSTVKRDAQFAAGLEKIGSSNRYLRNQILLGATKVKRSDIIVIAASNRKVLIEDEQDISDLADYLRKEKLGKVEGQILQVEEKQEDTIYLKLDDRLTVLKGRILSEINTAIKRKNISSITRIRQFIEELELLLSKD